MNAQLAKFTLQLAATHSIIETNLIEEKIRIEMSLGEEVRATRTIILILQMRHDTHVAETVAARREEGVLDDLHAYRAQNVFLRIERPPIVLRRRGSRGRSRRGLFRQLGLDRGHESAD